VQVISAALFDVYGEGKGKDECVNLWVWDVPHINNGGTSEAFHHKKSTILSCMTLLYNFTAFRFLLHVTIYDPLY